MVFFLEQSDIAGEKINKLDDAGADMSLGDQIANPPNRVSPFCKCRPVHSRQFC